MALNCNNPAVLYSARALHDGTPGVGATTKPFRGALVGTDACDIAYQYFPLSDSEQKVPAGTDARRFHYVYDTKTGIWNAVSMDPSRSGVTVDKTTTGIVFPVLTAPVPIGAAVLDAPAAMGSSYSFLYFILFLVFIFIAIMFAVRRMRSTSQTPTQ